MSYTEDFERLSIKLKDLIEQYRSSFPPKALLLHGISGVGKKTLASCLASILLCTDEYKKPCGLCRNCQRIEHNTHPNVLLLSTGITSKSIKIDDIRLLTNELASNPVENGKRVIIIQDADFMTPPAQNALLKSLEEPSKDDYYILTSSRRSMLLPTVLSRCSSFNFAPWDTKEIEHKLLDLGIKNAKTLAKQSLGSLGLALEISENESMQKLLPLVQELSANKYRLIDVPKLSSLISKDKEELDNFLRLLEQALLKGTDNIKKLQTLLIAKQMRQSSVSPQGIIDYFLINTAED